jgi:hypothetical protein
MAEKLEGTMITIGLRGGLVTCEPMYCWSRGVRLWGTGPPVPMVIAPMQLGAHFSIGRGVPFSVEVNSRVAGPLEQPGDGPPSAIARLTG